MSQRNLGKELEEWSCTHRAKLLHNAKLRVHLRIAPSFGSFTHNAKLLSRRANGDVTHEGLGRDMDSFVFKPQHGMLDGCLLGQSKIGEKSLKMARSV
jgi:hypothetical protein